MELEQLEDGRYLATDSDGTKWLCKREPFSNGMGKWFVKLKITEDYSDVMEKVEDDS